MTSRSIYDRQFAPRWYAVTVYGKFILSSDRQNNTIVSREQAIAHAKSHYPKTLLEVTEEIKEVIYQS